MFQNIFQPTPNSALARRRATQVALGLSTSGWYPWLMLVWSFWIFATPAYQTTAFPHWLWPTVGSYAIFLVLFYIANYRDMRYILACAISIAGLGLALTPLNPGAQGYIIYAAAFLAFAFRPQPAFGAIVLLFSVYSIEWFALGWPPVYLVSGLVLGLAVSGINISQAQKERADAALRLSHDEVRRLASLAERERIGRDLHDLLGHTLSLVALKSELAGKLLQRGDSLEARVAAQREIAEVARVAREALTQVRSAVSGIRAAGIAAELASARLLLETDGIALDARLDPHWLEGGVLPPNVENVLAMTVREAVTNIQRHAKATRADIALETVGGDAVLRIVDDGSGGAIDPGNGLRGMRERIESVRGRLRIESVRGKGTTLEVRVPLKQDDAGDLPQAVSA